MTPLVMTIVVVPVVLTIGALVVGRLVGHIPSTIGVPLWIGTVTLIIVSVLVGVFLYGDQQEEYEACLSRAEGRTVVDEGFGTLGTDLELLGLALGIDPDTSDPAALAFNRLSGDMTAVAQGLEPLDKADCRKPLTLGW